MRKIININKNWRFVRENIEKAMDKYFDDSQWAPVNVPHTWNAIDGTSGLEYHRGACWYRKTLYLDSLAKGNKIYIEFTGSNSVTDVYINGQHIGQHKGGFSTFRFDITEAVKIDSKNIIAVRVDNSHFDDVYPLMADFTFYGGIYRDVNIIIANNIHFDLMDYGSQGVYISQDQVSSEKALLTVKSKLVNHNKKDIKVRLWIDLLDANDQVVNYGAQELILTSGENTELDIPIIIENPTLWHGPKNPYMYQAKISLVSFNDTLDELIIPFGLRFFHVDPDQGFFLNGEHTPLKGVSRHQDRKDMGWAITPREHQEDMALIKELGATSIRLAHYQHDQFFYDLCDQEGMIVWAEIPFISLMSETDLEGINPKQQMIELIRQNYNHPSIMFWGIQNEIQIGGDRPEVRKLVKQLNELTKKEDPNRLTTMANVFMVDKDDPYNFITDLLGFNHYFGWYQGQVEDFQGWMQDFRQANPQLSLCISEYGAEGIIAYHTDHPSVSDYTEEYHTLYHEKAWNIFKNQAFLWGTYLWNMFDFGANIRDEGGVKGRNNKGLVSFDRKIKKDAFYMYKANWSSEKFVHITSKRFIDRATDTISIKIYSNCDKVTLYVNEIALSTKKLINCRVIFEDVPLIPGINHIKASAVEDDIILTDRAMFNRLDTPNESYTVPKDSTGIISNWFSLPDTSDIEIQELVFSHDAFSTDSTFGELLANQEAKAVLATFLGEDFHENPMLAMAKDIKLNFLASLDANMFNEKVMYLLNRELGKIKK